MAATVLCTSIKLFVNQPSEEKLLSATINRRIGHSLLLVAVGASPSKKKKEIEQSQVDFW